MNVLRSPAVVAANNKTSAAQKKRRAGGRPFKKGESGNPAGRAPGSKNKASREIKVWASSIVDHPLVQQRLLDDAIAGTLHPSILQMLFHYAKGKPKEEHSHTVKGALLHILGKGPLPSDEELGLV